MAAIPSNLKEGHNSLTFSPRFNYPVNVLSQRSISIPTNITYPKNTTLTTVTKKPEI